MLEQLNGITFTSGKPKINIMVRDFNLHNIEWINGIAVPFINPIS